MVKNNPTIISLGIDLQYMVSMIANKAPLLKYTKPRVKKFSILMYKFKISKLRFPHKIRMLFFVKDDFSL